ncbi:type II secretion system F family protein [candidate division WWE3 bacterium]|uniref:Type II secretion system F family protein n=1 Tax=candidate division WWE3 bacterium TaxID=2053526 RepID=A0A955LK48_UNCKA|nr:type II secretion system F family protein [candidate division WWE3 bacterium]
MKQDKAAKPKTKFSLNLPFGKPSAGQMAIFAKQLSVMVRTGLPVTEALGITAESTSGPLKKAILEVLKSVESGTTLADAFDNQPQAFSKLFVSTMRAGEVSGTLEDNLTSLATQLTNEKNLMGKVKSAMYYPIVVVIAAIVMGAIVAFVVLPKMTPIFNSLRIDLPFATKVLLWVANLFQAYGVIIIPAIVIGTLALVTVLAQRFAQPFTHLVLIKFPIVKRISKNLGLARFCRNLAMLLTSGLNIVEAFETTKDTIGNYYYAKALEKVSWHIGRGGKISESISEYEDLFPKIITRMVEMGEKTGQLEEVLAYLGEYYENEVDVAVRTFSSTLEPLLLLGVGGLVAFIALAIITPIYQLTGGI